MGGGLLLDAVQFPGAGSRAGLPVGERLFPGALREELEMQTTLNSVPPPLLLPGSSRSSLCYSCWKVSEPSQGLPLFLSVVQLDDQPVARNDGLTSSMVPLVPWMKAEEAKIFVGPERWFRTRLEWLSNLNPPTGGERRQICLPEFLNSPSSLTFGFL